MDRIMEQPLIHPLPHVALTLITIRTPGLSSRASSLYKTTIKASSGHQGDAGITHSQAMHMIVGDREASQGHRTELTGNKRWSPCYGLNRVFSLILNTALIC